MKIYNNNQSPITYENFIWIAEYNEKINNRLYLPEFEFKNSGFGNVNHTFDEINKEKLNSLAYIGNGYRFYYHVNDGIFNIYNSKIQLKYYDIENNIEYDFMNNKFKPYNDIILYKTIADEFDFKTNISKKLTIEYGMGYKKIINHFNIKCILHISMEKNIKPFLTFKIVSPININGELHFYIDNKLSANIKSPLKLNLGKTFKINIS